MGTQFVEVEHRGEVEWIFFNNFEKTLAGADADTVDVHTAIARAMHEARFDSSRVVKTVGSTPYPRPTTIRGPPTAIG
jgi:hypothetical protein